MSLCLKYTIPYHWLTDWLSQIFKKVVCRELCSNNFFAYPPILLKLGIFDNIMWTHIFHFDHLLFNCVWNLFKSIFWLVFSYFYIIRNIFLFSNNSDILLSIRDTETELHRGIEQHREEERDTEGQRDTERHRETERHKHNVFTGIWKGGGGGNTMKN